MCPGPQLVMLLSNGKIREELNSTIVEEFRHSSDREVSNRKIRREVIGLSFHGRAAAEKKLITRTNAHRRWEWCKQRRHCNLEQ